MREPKAKRIGSVPYLNSAPLTFGIEGETEFLPPSRLAKRLRTGALVAGLVSITEVLFNDLYDILDGVAVGSDGPVKSVFVAHKKPLEQVDVIHCDTASLSSVNLLKVTLAKRGHSPRLEPFGDYARAAELKSFRDAAASREVAAANNNRNVAALASRGLASANPDRARRAGARRARAEGELTAHTNVTRVGTLDHDRTTGGRRASA